MKKFDRKLILPDGSEYYGYGFGSFDERITEIVFNTSPVGYQEIISDPSYTYQTVVMTYPLIGNYGIAEDDFETEFSVLIISFFFEFVKLVRLIFSDRISPFSKE